MKNQQSEANQKASGILQFVLLYFNLTSLKVL